MNVRDLYNVISTRYPQDQRDLNSLAWPLHQPALNVQYVDESGRPVGTLIPNPTDLMFVEPLAGPFYDLPVVGICAVIPPTKFGAWKKIRLVVQNGQELTLSAVVSLHIKASELKGLASDWGIHWYHVNFDWPWTYTCLPELDDCVKYERKNNKGRV